MAEGSVIGQGTVVRGNVRGEGSIEIYGRVEGDVSVTGDVTVGEHGSVRGDITGSRITVGGNIAGNLEGSEAVVLEATAQVNGDLSAPRLGIEEGALVRGNIRMEVSGGSGRAEQRRAAPRPVEVRRAEPARAESPRAAQAAPQKKQPPAPIVPAFRGLQARKKKARAR